MKRIAIILSIVAISLAMLSCGGSADKQTKETKETPKVETIAQGDVVVYYFHGKQRCKTCIGIQNVSQEAIAETFAENDNVTFKEVDFSEKPNTELANKYEVAFSSLIVATTTDHLDLTEFAFANVNSNPDTLKETLVAEVNNFLNQ